MHPKQATLLQKTDMVLASLREAGAIVLWKYTDPDGKEFYAAKRQMTIRSPFSGRSFSVKPERYTIGDVGKELKEEGAKLRSALWKYVDGEGGEFYLPTRITTPLKSPFTGKSFTPKPEKDPLTDVSKQMREDQKAKSSPAGGKPSAGGKKKTAADWQA